MPRISFSLELIQLIEDVKEPNESITQFVHRYINKMLKEEYDILNMKEIIHRRMNKSNGRNQYRRGS